MIYQPELNRSQFAKSIFRNVTQIAFYAIDGHLSPKQAAQALEQQRGGANAEWQQLLSDYSPEVITNMITACAEKVDHARNVILDASATWNDEASLQFQAKRALRYTRMEPNFTHAEAWRDYIYRSLSFNANPDSPTTRSETIAQLCKTLWQLDHYELPVSHEDEPYLKTADLSIAANAQIGGDDPTFYVNEETKTDVTELYTIAHQYVISQLGWILHYRDHQPRSLFDRSKEIPTAYEIVSDALNDLGNQKISPHSQQELIQILTAHAHRYLADYCSYRLLGSDDLQFKVSLDLYQSMPLFRQTRREEAEYLQKAMDIALYLETIEHLTGSFITSEQIHTGMHPTERMPSDAETIIKLIRQMQEKYPDDFGNEDLELFGRFVHEVEPLIQ